MVYETEKIEFTDGDVFEDLRSLEQELAFAFCAETFSKCNVEFSEDKFSILGIMKPVGRLFTNLGWLLSDQCSHSVVRCRHGGCIRPREKQKNCIK